MYMYMYITCMYFVRFLNISNKLFSIKTQCDLNVCEHYNSRRMSGQKNVFYDALYRDQIPTQVSFVMARLDIGDG